MWEHAGWGDSIYFIEEMKKVAGHLRDKPNKGDLLYCKMQSGKIGSFKVTNVRYMPDPRDQFFADVKPLKYVEDI